MGLAMGLLCSPVNVADVGVFDVADSERGR